MSIESARTFVEKMRHDLKFKNQILAAEPAAERLMALKSLLPVPCR